MLKFVPDSAVDVPGQSVPQILMFNRETAGFRHLAADREKDRRSASVKVVDESSGREGRARHRLKITCIFGIIGLCQAGAMIIDAMRAAPDLPWTIAAGADPRA